MKNALLTLVLLLGSMAAQAADAPVPAFTEGKEYKEVPKPETHLNPKKVEVEEYFWYGCPHCYRFEPLLAPWLEHKPEEVLFRRIPHNMGRSTGEMHAQAFHMAEVLGIVGRIHMPMYKAIQDEKKNMDTLADICELFGKVAGVNDDTCRYTATVDDVQERMRRDDYLIHRYQVISTPTIVVDGKYLTNAVMAGGMDQLLPVVDFLIAKQKAARGIKSLPTPVGDNGPATGPKHRPGAPSPFQGAP